MTRPITCSLSECHRPVVARTWCGMHYARWNRTGDPRKVRRLEPDPRTGTVRIPLSRVIPAKRAMAWAGQVRFEAALERLR